MLTEITLKDQFVNLDVADMRVAGLWWDALCTSALRTSEDTYF